MVRLLTRLLSQCKITDKIGKVLLFSEREVVLKRVFLPNIQHTIELGFCRFRYRILKPVLKEIVRNAGTNYNKKIDPAKFVGSII